MLQEKYVLAVRRYRFDGTFVCVDKVVCNDLHWARGTAQAFLNVSKTFPVSGHIPLMPTNISIKGMDGKFVSWNASK